MAAETSERMDKAEARVLIVDDDSAFAETLAEGLEARGWCAAAARGAQEAAALVKARQFDALVTDLRMPDVDGMQLLTLAKALAPERPVIIMTAFSAIDSAV